MAELHCVPSLRDSALFRWTGWLLTKNAIHKFGSGAVLVFFVALMALERSDWFLSAFFAFCVLMLIVIYLPRIAQLRRFVPYYGLSLSEIADRLTEYHVRRRWFGYVELRAAPLYALILALAFGVALLDIALFDNSTGTLLAAFGPVVVAAWIYVSRRFARSAEETMQMANSPPVVLLRSFEDDGMPDGSDSLWAYTPTFETLLKQIFDKFGPFVAIGKPAETIQPVGAARTYQDDDIWRAKASELMRSSRMIVLLAGHSSGLTWELSHIVEAQLQHKLLVLFPPVEQEERRSRLAMLRACLKDTVWASSLSTAMPDDVVTMQLGNDGSVVLVTARGYRNDRVFFRDAVRIGIFGLLGPREVPAPPEQRLASQRA